MKLRTDVPYFQATLAMALIIPLAVDSVRKRSYEFFLILHIAFSIVAVVGCF
jgi:ferric-chelate reductase